MRYAIISDIHANHQSWQRILEDIDEAGAEALICLGDIVGYGPMPQAVLNGVRELASGVVLGNHDAAVCGRMDASIFNDNARKVVEWTREQLDSGSIDFLNKLPLAIEYEDLLFVHAEAIEPARFDYIREPDQAAANLAACHHRVIFYGHTHHPTIFTQQRGMTIEQPLDDFTLAENRRYVINVGTAGEPRDPADLRAKYVLFDSGKGTVQFRSVDFDAEAYRADLKREGLDIEPFFLRALDFAEGKYTAGSLRKEEAMSRLPAIPESSESTKPRRLVVAPIPVSGASRNVLPLAATRRARSLARHAPPPKKSKANIALALTAVFLLAALVPVGYIAYNKHLAPAESSDRFSIPYKPPKANAVNDEESAKAFIAAASPKAAPKPSKAPPKKFPPLEKDLLSYWSADKNNLVSRGPLKPKPTAHGKPRIIRGHFGKVFNFGARDGISFGEGNEYNIDDRGFTASFWIQLPKPDERNRLLLGTRTATESDAPGWAIYTTRGVLGAILSSGSSTRQLIYPQFPSQPQGTYHIALVVDTAQGTMALYHEGKRVKEGKLGSVGRSVPSPGRLQFGVDPGSKDNGIAGKLDDLAIWRRPLAPEEIARIFQGKARRKKPLNAFFSK